MTLALNKEDGILFYIWYCVVLPKQADLYSLKFKLAALRRTQPIINGPNLFPPPPPWVSGNLPFHKLGIRKVYHVQMGPDCPPSTEGRGQAHTQVQVPPPSSEIYFFPRRLS